MANKMLGIFILIQTIAIAQARKYRMHEVMWRFGAWEEFSGGSFPNEFQLGDDVVFMYPPGQHNVIEVDRNGFDNCVAPPSAKALTSGQDWVKLNAYGTRYFICGIGQHCKEKGMKYIIDVNAPKDDKEFIVGFSKGWARNVDYEVWKTNSIFDVGDKLVFNYKKGKHNVIQVDEASYKQCIVPPKHEALTSGHDEVILQKAGGVGFISGIGDDCKKGMKFFINVFDDKTKPPELKPARKLVTES